MALGLTGKAAYHHRLQVGSSSTPITSFCNFSSKGPFPIDFTMGGRLSMPRGPDGISETSKPTSSPTPARLRRNGGIINGRVRVQCQVAEALHC